MALAQSETHHAEDGMGTRRPTDSRPKAPPTPPIQSQGLCRQRPTEPKTHRAKTWRRWLARRHRGQHDERMTHRRCCTVT
eukprot:scaffold61110_cov71-Phaeocystis_antarctica.AAC.1